MRRFMFLLPLLAACGGSEPLPPTAPVTPIPAVSTDPSTPASTLSLESYDLLWESETPGWNSAITFTVDGDVVAATGGALTVHARHDGKKLRHGPLCESQLLRRGPLWADERGFVLGLCSDGLYEIRIEDMARRKVHDLPNGESFEDRIEMAVAHGDRIALASRSGRVVFRHRRSFDVMAEHKLEGEGNLRSMCFSPDGTLAISRRDQPTALVRNGRILTYDVAPVEHGFFAFSPDGSRAFVVPRYFVAGELILAEGLIRGETRISSWLTDSKYLTDVLVAATGANGLVLYDVQRSAQRVLDGDTGEGLGVREDKAVICAAGRRGRLVCFGTAKQEPTRLRPLGDSG
jgi:hypothetical protein